MFKYVAKEPEELGRKAAELIALKLEDAIEKNGRARIILSTGASQFETLKYLVQKKIDWEKVTMFHLDEYIGISENHPASFRKYLRERFTSLVPVTPYFVCTEGDLEENLRFLTEKLREEVIDVGVIGIGENGHIAFNDPPADFESKSAYKVVTLEERCRRQQVNEGWFPNINNVPARAVSMTPYQIMQCQTIVTCVPGERKADAIKKTLEAGAVTKMIPATLLTMHSDWNLFLDEDSASLLD